MRPISDDVWSRIVARVAHYDARPLYNVSRTVRSHLIQRACTDALWGIRADVPECLVILPNEAPTLRQPAKPTLDEQTIMNHAFSNYELHRCRCPARCRHSCKRFAPSYRILEQLFISGRIGRKLLSSCYTGSNIWESRMGYTPRWIVNNITFALALHGRGILAGNEQLEEVSRFLSDPAPLSTKLQKPSDIALRIVICLPRKWLRKLMHTPMGIALVSQGLLLMRFHPDKFSRQPYFEFLLGDYRRMINGG